MQERNGQAPPQPTPGAQPWPTEAIARYLTVAGATVDIVYTSATGWLTATCTGCGNVDRTSTDGLLQDTPEQEQQRVEKTLPESREQAQTHAAVCRALPRPQ